MGSNVAIIGTGYVGLTTGACFAHIGHNVVCADVDPAKGRSSSRGELPIFEPRLQEIVTETMRAGRLRFVLGAAEAAKDCEFAYLCVPTPQSADGSADLRFIETAAAEVAQVLPSEAVVVNKSTVPVGSTKIVEQVLQRPDIKVVSNPEFLREGSAVHDFLHPDRIVIGSDDQATAIRVAALYLGITAPLIVTDPASAETIKYAATRSSPRRCRSSTPSPRCASTSEPTSTTWCSASATTSGSVTSSCAPVLDGGAAACRRTPAVLVHMAEAGGHHFDLLKGVISANDEQRDRIVEKVRNAVGGSLEGATVAVWGLTFKANTDDLRESPALRIVAELSNRGAKIRGRSDGPHHVEEPRAGRRSVRSVRWCGRPRGVDRVGPVPLGRPGGSWATHGEALHRRCPKRLGPRRRSTQRLRLRGCRTLIEEPATGSCGRQPRGCSAAVTLRPPSSAPTATCSASATTSPTTPWKYATMAVCVPRRYR